MVGGQNISASNFFVNASSSMSSTRSASGNMNEADLRQLSKKGAAYERQMTKDETSYVFTGNLEEQMNEFFND